jgi:hypothetical protein
MITDLCRERIENYDDNNSRWRLGNAILYEMVARYPRHTNEDEIVSKLWIIGRTYAAAIERRPNKAGSSADFYYDRVAPKLSKPAIDEKIDSLRKYTSITAENLPHILSVHKYLMDLFDELTQEDKRSLTSKYLHFHLPELFLIYDSRVASVITKFTGNKPRGLSIPQDADKVYAEFCYKAMLIYQDLNGTYSDTKPRVIDNILLRYCDEIASKTNEAKK